MDHGDKAAISSAISSVSLNSGTRTESKISEAADLHRFETKARMHKTHLLWVGEVVVDLLVEDVEYHVQEVPAGSLAPECTN
jgi:hypothetical protein